MNTKRINVVCFVFVFGSLFNSVFSQESRFSTGFFSGDLCGMLSTSSVFSIQSNPATLVSCEQTEIGTAYSTNYYTTNMLCSRINACTPVKQNTIGTSVIVFGNAHFRETYYDFCIARRITSHHSVGMKCDIQQEFQDEYSRSFSVFPEFAFFGEQKRLLYGIHLINPLQLRTKSTKHETISKLQAGYKINKELSCLTQLQQTSINKFTFSLELQYNLQEKITIDVQYDNQEQPINLMITLPYKRFRCFVETTFNYYLGITNCVAFSVVL